MFFLVAFSTLIVFANCDTGQGICDLNCNYDGTCDPTKLAKHRVTPFCMKGDLGDASVVRCCTSADTDEMTKTGEESGLRYMFYFEQFGVLSEVRYLLFRLAFRQNCYVNYAARSVHVGEGSQKNANRIL